MATAKNSDDMKMQSGDVVLGHDLINEVDKRDHVTAMALRHIWNHLVHAHGLDLQTELDSAQQQANEQEAQRQQALIDENAKIEQERAQVRKKMGDPAKETIPVPIDSLPSQQKKEGE